jgi:alkylation response protein AidB-like acyl-CoA dehydrogenase
VQLTFDPAVEAFRSEFVTFLDEHLPTEAETTERSRSTSHIPEWARRWQRLEFDHGWLLPGNPPEFGGRNATLLQQFVHREELSRRRITQSFNPQGVGIIAASLLTFGTPEQKQRWAVPILRGEMTASLGMSEPGAGSDLAGLRTAAVRDGDEFVVNGQKVWTSVAQFADWIFLLVRTDPDAPKHKGISYLLVDMHSPGITVRPLVQMTGGKGFNEVFFEDVRVPRKNLVSEKNNGWQVALTTLMFERSGSGGGEGIMTQINQLAELAKQIPRNGKKAWDDSGVRQKIVKFAAEAYALKYTGYRQLTRQLKGIPPGPEGSMMKLCGTELSLAIAQYAMELLGPYSQFEYNAPFALDRGKWSLRMLAARGPTIYAGTNQIQHNIIGERVLGLPKGS